MTNWTELETWDRDNVHEGLQSGLVDPLEYPGQVWKNVGSVMRNEERTGERTRPEIFAVGELAGQDF